MWCEVRKVIVVRRSCVLDQQLSIFSLFSISGFTFWKCLPAHKHCLHILASLLSWIWSPAGYLIQAKPSFCSQPICIFSWILKENGDLCFLWCHFLVAETVTEVLYINLVLLPNVSIHLIITATQSVSWNILFHGFPYILAALQPIRKCHCLYYSVLLWATVTCTFPHGGIQSVLSNCIHIHNQPPLKG